MHQPYALLDDLHKTGRSSRYYHGNCKYLHCTQSEEFSALLLQLEKALRDGWHSVALFSYELGAAWQGISPREHCKTPLCEFLLFEKCDLLSADEVNAWLAKQDSVSQTGLARLYPSIDEAQFHADLGRIHDLLEAGHSYQVNYTFRLHFDAYGHPAKLYSQLRARQPTAYGALIQLPDGRCVLSASPELFVRLDEGMLTVRPMKGTARIGKNEQETVQHAKALALDSKNRAENLMITDLLRNDLGRIASLGSVAVPELFAVEQFGEVLQMSSKITAKLAIGQNLESILRALFPCGSITGAPKLRSMEIIRELELDSRGLYTGGIGYFSAPTSTQTIGNFCLSVPIRTLTLDAPNDYGVRVGSMGIGSGIVFDSNSQEEYHECQLKARFAINLPKGFELIETFYATRKNGCRNLKRHLARLANSAAYFGFVCDLRRIATQLRIFCASLAEGAYRVRLLLSNTGTCEISCTPLDSCPKLITVGVSSEVLNSCDLFLRHKTTSRQKYDSALRDANTQGFFDVLFFNERDEICEGARSNVLVKLDGQWFTPDTSCGLLPGIMRSVLLEKREVFSRCITRTDLVHQQGMRICNALRGVMDVQWVL